MYTLRSSFHLSLTCWLGFECFKCPVTCDAGIKEFIDGLVEKWSEKVETIQKMINEVLKFKF